MSSQNFSPIVQPKISHPVFLVRQSNYVLSRALQLNVSQGFLWTGTAVSLCFLVFRLVVKIRSFRRVYSDDCLVIFSWVLLLGSAALWQVQSVNLYELYAVESGQKPLTLGFIDTNTELLRSLTPFAILFYTCLWVIKLSFLLFFRRLGLNVRGQKIWWWTVLVITVLTWIATIADNDYKCSLEPIEFIWCMSEMIKEESELTHSQLTAALQSLSNLCGTPTLAIAQWT
ncbi:MAG: hypothetical protein Q9174_006079 [Haloplaca sp. 1 TL-2023]